MRFFTVFLFLIFTFSCESDSISDVSGSLNEDLTLYELPRQNTRVSTNQQTTVQVGDTVRCIGGSGTHNLRSTSGIENFDSGFISEQGYQFQWIFNQIGSTQYVCDPHPNSMFGTITVTE